MADAFFFDFVAEESVFSFFNVCFYTFVFELGGRGVIVQNVPSAPPLLVTNRQKSSLKSLKIKTRLVPVKSIRELCHQSVRQSE